MYRKLEFSTVTNSSLSILYPYVDNIKNEWYKMYGGYHTGIDISSKSAYSIVDGVVIQIGQDYQSYSVTVQYDSDNIFRYKNLKSVNVNEGQVIHQSDLVGTCIKFFHFEYASRERSGSIWPVRIGEVTYYKHNPEPIIDGKINIFKYDQQYTLTELDFDENWNNQDVINLATTSNSIKRKN